MIPIRILMIVIAALLASGCSTEDKKPAGQQKTVIPIPDVPFTADMQLPNDIDSVGIDLVETLAAVLPSQSEQQFGEQASVYRDYSFVGRAASRYRVNEKPIRAEIAQFATGEDAYGFYAYHRPDSGVIFFRMGAECYVLGSRVRFVQGDYVVTLEVTADSAAVFETARPLALSIAIPIGGRPVIPSYYLLFPYRDKIGPSQRYSPVDFLGIPGLNKVFTCDYAVAGDTVQLFFTMDEGGEKFLKLAQVAKSTGKTLSQLSGFAYNENYILAFEHPERGIIVAGLVSKKLVGIINYNPEKTEKLIKGWVTGLK